MPDIVGKSRTSPATCRVAGSGAIPGDGTASGCAFRSTATTVAPRPRNSAVMAAPMPLTPPVTRPTAPVRSPAFGLMLTVLFATRSKVKAAVLVGKQVKAQRCATHRLRLCPAPEALRAEHRIRCGHGVQSADCHLAPPRPARQDDLDCRRLRAEVGDEDGYAVPPPDRDGRGTQRVAGAGEQRRPAELAHVPEQVVHGKYQAGVGGEEAAGRLGGVAVDDAPRPGGLEPGGG